MKTDIHLKRDVLDELDWEPSVDAAHIGVTARDGLITLTGHVPVYAEKHLADQVARRVHGVRAIANEIEVRPAEDHVRDDEDIAAAALHGLNWDVHVPAEHLQVTVEDGWLTVEGSVEHQFQKEAVYRVLRRLTGARGVTNAIQVAPKAMTSAIKENIEAALRRSATVDSRKLGVEVDERCVILTGDVHSHSELDEAERIAWSARGVHRVQNCITITPWGFGPAEEWGY